MINKKKSINYWITRSTKYRKSYPNIKISFNSIQLGNNKHLTILYGILRHGFTLTR